MTTGKADGVPLRAVWTLRRWVRLQGTLCRWCLSGEGWNRTLPPGRVALRPQCCVRLSFTPSRRRTPALQTRPRVACEMSQGHGFRLGRLWPGLRRARPRQALMSSRGAAFHCDRQAARRMRSDLTEHMPRLPRSCCGESPPDRRARRSLPLTRKSDTCFRIVTKLNGHPG